jgi:N-acetyl-gamma-glutamyl-phosphate reductase
MPWYSGVPDDTASLGSRYPEGAGEFEPQLVANPGCYATSVLMAVLPLLKRDLIEPDSLVIDAKSGTSGAGRKPSENLLFTEVEGECLPYRLGKHQHYPEICQYAAHFSGVAIEPFFTTHLLSVRRGIITGLYAKLRENVTEADLDRAYGLDYADYGLVEWGALNGLNARSVAHRLSLKRVVGSAMTRLHYQVDGRRLYLFSLIDNLVKGAAGQAIENFNRIRGLALGTGLKELEGVL